MVTFKIVQCHQTQQYIRQKHKRETEKTALANKNNLQPDLVHLIQPPVRKLLSSLHFYRASICEGSLGSHNSVCPSVCPSHAWIVTKLNDALQIFLYHTKGQSLCYSDTKSGWSATPPSLWNQRSKWPTPFEKRWLRPISAHSVSTVGDSKKSSITTNIKSTTGFPMSHRWSAYVAPKCPKGWLKERFFRFWV